MDQTSDSLELRNYYFILFTIIYLFQLNEQEQTTL